MADGRATSLLIYLRVLRYHWRPEERSYEDDEAYLDVLQWSLNNHVDLHQALTDDRLADDCRHYQPKQIVAIRAAHLIIPPLSPEFFAHGAGVAHSATGLDRYRTWLDAQETVDEGYSDLDLLQASCTALVRALDSRGRPLSPPPPAVFPMPKPPLDSQEVADMLEREDRRSLAVDVP